MNDDYHFYGPYDKFPYSYNDEYKITYNEPKYGFHSLNGQFYNTEQERVTADDCWRKEQAKKQRAMKELEEMARRFGKEAEEKEKITALEKELNERLEEIQQDIEDAEAELVDWHTELDNAEAELEELKEEKGNVGNIELELEKAVGEKLKAKHERDDWKAWCGDARCKLEEMTLQRDNALEEARKEKLILSSSCRDYEEMTLQRDNALEEATRQQINGLDWKAKFERRHNDLRDQIDRSINLKAENNNQRKMMLVESVAIIVLLLMGAMISWANFSTKGSEEINAKEMAEIRQMVILDPDCQITLDEVLKDGKITVSESEELWALHEENKKIHSEFVNLNEKN